MSLLQAEIAAATGTARSAWWDAHSDATQATVKNLRLHWKFSAKYPQFPNGDSYHPVSMVPRTYQQWDAIEIQKCITALQKGELVAVAWEPDRIAEHYPGGISSAQKSASSSNSRHGAAKNSGHRDRSRSGTPASVETTDSNKDLIAPKHYQRLMERLRALVKNATGYDLPTKQNTHILCDHLSGKGAYKWNFSNGFRRFPQNSPSKWTTTQCRLVEEALDSGTVSVTGLPSTRTSVSPVPSHAAT
ncbi:hypothetical protein V492_03347, partial [Pseudogymnoascus sp. VKM F-4246]